MASANRGPGRPSSGAKERILAAGLETLLAEGYAGLSYAKVADRCDENKSLISYYFGSKDGLVAAVAEVVGQSLTTEVLARIADAESVPSVIEGAVDGVWAVMDEDPRLARLYFDLSAVSVVEDPVRVALQEVKAGWRAVIARHLGRAGVPVDQTEAAAVFVIAGVEGLAIEALDPVSPEKLEAARAMFIAAAAAQLERAVVGG